MSTSAEQEEQQELFEAVEADLREVPLDAIEPTDTANASLSNAISNLGTVSTPVLQLSEDEDYGYRIIDGRRRIAALRKQDVEEVTAHVVGPEFNAEADALTAAMNIVREPNPIAEARAIANLIDQGYTPDSLSRIGIPKQTVKKRMRLWETPEEIREGVRGGDIAKGTAEKVANLSTDLQRQCVNFYQEEGKLRHKDVTEIRQSNQTEQAEQMSDRLFDTPDVSRELSESTQSEPEERDEQEKGGEEPPTPQPAERDVEVPKDADAFQDYIQIAGAVRGYIVGDEYETGKEAAQGAIAAGTKLGLAPEEVLAILSLPPSHFLPDEAIEALREQIK